MGLVFADRVEGYLEVTPRLEDDLRMKIAAYRELAQSSRTEMLPRRDRLEQLCRLLPVRYVHRRTGRAHFAKVERLLYWASGDFKYKPTTRTCGFPKKKKRKETVDPGKLLKDYKASRDYLPLFDFLLDVMGWGYSPAVRHFKDSPDFIVGAQPARDTELGKARPLPWESPPTVKTETQSDDQQVANKQPIADPAKNISGSSG